jgi:hypothetical protein
MRVSAAYWRILHVGPPVFPQPIRAAPFSDLDIGEKPGKSAKRRSKAAAPIFGPEGSKARIRRAGG